MNSKTLIPAAPSAGTIEAYISSAYQIPMLSLEEEQSLAARLRARNDLDAARQLIMSHLRFVIRIARGYVGYGLPLSDLIQEGTVGLMKAVRRFDPELGVRLVSFAVHWIRAEIHEFILRNWRIVKIATTKAQRKLFFNLRSAKKSLGWFSKEEVDEVARELEVKPETVLEMEARLANHDLSFDPLETDDDAEAAAMPSNYLSDVRMEPAALLERSDYSQNQNEQLYRALEQLDARSRAVIEARWLTESKATLQDLAAQYGVSAERIRQIEKAALKKIKGQLQED
ncbi:RNA polymerase factor sigma-32 [Achromatium sp. WMS2]|nr:RNA polymerase factor sigma-32 [Achromatium sp. WMS2]